MTFIERLLHHPHAIIGLSLVGVLAGVLAYLSLPINLFPDTTRPTVSVVTRWPGATAEDMAREVTHPIEVRVAGVDGVRRVTSTSRDQVSAVSVELEYGNDIDLATNRVQTEVTRAAVGLPAGVQAPILLRATDAARPVMVLAATAAPGSGLDLAGVRRFCENPLRDALLQVPGVADVEVFGGEQRLVAVALDRDRLVAHDLSVTDVARALAQDNVAEPGGLVPRGGLRLALSTRNLAVTPDDLAEVLVPLRGGDYVRVGDLGQVAWGHEDLTSWYRGNGEDAVAVALLRSERGETSRALAGIEAALPAIRADFPMLELAVTETQGRIIGITVANMLEALRDAVIMAVLVILVFLADTRAALVTAVSLPFTYLLTFAAMQALGYQFNLVTLTAVIVAVGMLVDDAIVVIENIERRMRDRGESGLAVAARGTAEVWLPVLSGTVGNAIVLAPIVFIGGYVETVLRPFALTLITALAASFVVSVTIIPLLTPWVLRPGAWDPLRRPLLGVDRFLLDPLKRLYAALVAWGLRHRLAVGLLLVGLLVASLAQMPVIGRELMPLMDTGILLVDFEAEPDTGEAGMQRVAAAVDDAIQRSVPTEWLVSLSTVVGAEAGVRSFGAARTFQQGRSTVTLVDRFHRDASIYAIEEDLRARLTRLPGLTASAVSEYGATPLASLRGSVDVMLSGPDTAVLDHLADQVKARLDTVQGLSATLRSWQGGSRRLDLAVDSLRARNHGLTAGAVAAEVRAAIGGEGGGRLRVPAENPIPVRVRLTDLQRSDPELLAGLPVRAGDGRLEPLSNLASVTVSHAPASITHQSLVPTVDVIGYRHNVAVSHLQDRVEAALADLELPRGFHLSHEGEIAQMLESFGRLGRALALGLAVLYLVLVLSFRSYLLPVAILLTLPLAAIGAVWSMLLAGKHGCMPSFMGLILLMGVVVKNGILLVDFYREALARGTERDAAILEAVRLRTRPILMTAGSTIVGMLPIALEWAVGIERLSPLAVVAVGGLVTGTFLTLFVVPVLLSLVPVRRTA